MGSEVELTGDNFDAEIASGVTAVDFWAPWCGPCKMQGPILDKVAEQVGDKVKIAKCNIDEAPTVASKLGIRSIPTIVIFGNGKETERLVGLQTEKTLLEKLS